MKSLMRAGIRLAAGLVCSFTLVTAFSAMSFADEPMPKIEATPTTFDLGTISDDETGKATFMLKNVGTAELIIIEAKPSCGCTVANLSSKKLAPGETSKLEAVYNAHNASGPIHKFITVRSNDADPTRQTLSLSITGTVVPKPQPGISINPRELPGFDIAKGGKSVQIVRITSDGQEDLVISEMTPTLGMSAKFEGMDLAPGVTQKMDVHLKPGEFKDMEVTIAPTLPVGAYMESVTIRSNSKRVPAIMFRVQGEIK